MRPKKPRPKNSGEGCQYIYNLGLEDEHRCHNPITPPAWRYCDLHSESGPKQNKAITQKNGEYVKDFRRDKRDDYLRQNSNHQFRRRHRLTKPQLKILLDRAKSPQEQYPSSMDDFHQHALAELIDIRCILLNPPADLPSAAKAAEKQTLELLNKLKRQQDICPNSETERLLVLGHELERDTSKRLSDWAFIEISRKAKKVRELWRQPQGELLSLAYAIFVEVELFRLQFLAYPNQRHFLERARTQLYAAKHVCDLAITCYAGEHKQTAGLLGCHVPALEGILAFNGGEPEPAANCIKLLEQRANAVADYGTSPVTEIIKFSCLIHQAEFYVRFNKIELAYKYFDEAERIFENIKRHSIESQLEVAYVKARLGLATKSQDREKDLQEYIMLFQCHPFLTVHNNLQELKRLYPEDVDVSLFKDVPIYFDTMFRRLHHFLVHI